MIREEIEQNGGGQPMETYQLIAPRTYLDRRGRLFEKTASDTMRPVENERVAAEERYVARHQKGEKKK